MPGFITKLAHFTFCVFAFERGQINHVEDQLQAILLRLFLDTPCADTGSPLFNARLIHRGTLGKAFLISGSLKAIGAFRHVQKFCNQR